MLLTLTYYLIDFNISIIGLNRNSRTYFDVLVIGGLERGDEPGFRFELGRNFFNAEISFFGVCKK
jgi:hypothetical protein